MNKETLSPGTHSGKPKAISRRKFLKGFGSGVVGTAVMPGALAAIAANNEKEKSTEVSPPHADKVMLSLKVNGKRVRALVEPRTTLAELLRDHLHLTGTKIVCNHGECGGCTVVMNGKAVYSCHMLALDAEGKEILTIEGLMNGEKLHPLQQAFIDKDGFQCGFCTPGQIMAAYALLLENREPSEEQVKEAMSGNICRCGAYPNIIKSVMEGAAHWPGR